MHGMILCTYTYSNICMYISISGKPHEITHHKSLLWLMLTWDYENFFLFYNHTHLDNKRFLLWRGGTNLILRKSIQPSFYQVISISFNYININFRHISPCAKYQVLNIVHVKCYTLVFHLTMHVHVPCWKKYLITGKYCIESTQINALNHTYVIRYSGCFQFSVWWIILL